MSNVVQVNVIGGHGQACLKWHAQSTQKNKFAIS